MRILGIDYGDSRIGLAMSDIMGWTASGLETVKWDGENLDVVIDRIKQLVLNNEVRTIVVGIPKNMNGTLGPRAQKTLAFTDRLKQEISGINVVTWDERLTTVAADRTMHELGIKTKRKKQVVDQIAAVYILQGYLDSIRNKKD